MRRICRADDSVSRMFLQVGQRVDVKDLIYGLMVSSGNDAAVALSEYLAGSTDAFADQMNGLGAFDATVPLCRRRTEVLIPIWEPSK